MKSSLLVVIVSFFVLAFSSLYADSDRRINNDINVDSWFKNFNLAATKLATASKELSSENINILLKVCSSEEPYPNFTKDQWHSIRNDIMDLLLTQKSPIEELSQNFALWIKETKDPVWKNYLFQKGVLFYNASHSKETKQEVLESLQEAIYDADVGIPGTSILALYAISKNENDISPKVKILSESIVNSDVYSPTDRMTAINVFLNYDLNKAKAYARKFLSSSDTHPNLKMVSIYVLSNEANQKDLAIIKEFSKSKDVRLKNAADLALAKAGNKFKEE